MNHGLRDRTNVVQEGRHVANSQGKSTVSSVTFTPYERNRREDEPQFSAYPSTGVQGKG